ncbi:MAG: tetratricopeptide repeat protein, partial [Pseudomonadota bacterium]
CLAQALDPDIEAAVAACTYYQADGAKPEQPPTVDCDNAVALPPGGSLQKYTESVCVTAPPNSFVLVREHGASVQISSNGTSQKKVWSDSPGDGVGAELFRPSDGAPTVIALKSDSSTDGYFTAEAIAIGDLDDATANAMQATALASAAKVDRPALFLDAREAWANTDDEWFAVLSAYQYGQALRRVDAFSESIDAYKQCEAKAAGAVGTLLGKAEKLRPALPAAQRCQILTSNSKAKALHGRCVNGIGNSLRSGGEHEAAEAFFLDTACLTGGGVDDYTAASARNNLALTYRQRGDFELARDEFAAAIDAYVRAGADARSALPRLNLGSLLQRMGNSTEATTYFQEALRLVAGSVLADPSTDPVKCHRLAQVLLQTSEFRRRRLQTVEAVANARQAARIWERVQRESWNLSARTEEALALMEGGDAAAAKRVLKKALENAYEDDKPIVGASRLKEIQLALALLDADGARLEELAGDHADDAEIAFAARMAASDLALANGDASRAEELLGEAGVQPPDDYSSNALALRRAEIALMRGDAAQALAAALDARQFFVDRSLINDTLKASTIGVRALREMEQYADAIRLGKEDVTTATGVGRNLLSPR